jgi:hypothetical protein
LDGVAHLLDVDVGLGDDGEEAHGAAAQEQAAVLRGEERGARLRPRIAAQILARRPTAR